MKSILMILLMTLACGVGTSSSPEADAAEYKAKLLLCNQKAVTLKESIDCENEWRKLEKRPLRPYPANMKDGGADGSL